MRTFLFDVYNEDINLLTVGKYVIMHKRRHISWISAQKDNETSDMQNNNL